MIKILQRILRYFFISIGLILTMSIGALSGFVYFGNEQIVSLVREGNSLVNKEINGVKKIFSNQVDSLKKLINGDSNQDSIKNKINDLEKTITDLEKNNPNINIDSLKQSLNTIKNVPNDFDKYLKDVDVEFNKTINDISGKVNDAFIASKSWISNAGKTISCVIFWTIVSVISAYLIFSLADKRKKTNK